MFKVNLFNIQFVDFLLLKVYLVINPNEKISSIFYSLINLDCSDNDKRPNIHNVGRRCYQMSTTSAFKHLMPCEDTLQMHVKHKFNLCTL